MPSAHEQFSEHFRKWEERGRGWHVFDEPIHPEPPFRPFGGHNLIDTAAIDDGRRPPLIRTLFRKLLRWPAEQDENALKIEPDSELEPRPFTRGDLVELQTSLPADLDITEEAFKQFFLAVSFCESPVAFELLGIPNRVVAQFASDPSDTPLVRRQLQAHFPDAVFRPTEQNLTNAWNSCLGTESLVIEFGLGREFMYPLATGKIDPFIGIVGALSELKSDELGLLQVLWQKAKHPWPASIMNSVLGDGGKPFFVNAPRLANAAEDKTNRPLFAAVVRIMTCAKTYDRTLQLARDLAGALSVFDNPSGNELIPLSNDGYPHEEHIDDALFRQTRRTGMILNADELAGFVHLPGSAVRCPALLRLDARTRAAPPSVRQSTGLLLGYNEHIGEIVPVRLSPDERVRHCHIIGSSGTGKSTLLLNLITQDIKNGNGVAVLDPHGDLIDRILGVIPDSRINDVVLVDPSDEQYSVGFNVLAAHSELEKTLLASDLVSVFQRLSTSWGDQMTSVLQNAVLAFLECDRGGTIADLRRFLIEPAFRAQHLKSVRDSEVVYYWQKGFPHLAGAKSVGPIITRLDALLAKKPIRHMVSQEENRLDFAHIMDSGKIFLAKLPEGLLGRENSHLIGSLLISKFQQTAMSRQAQQIEARRDHWIYCDEFANFITPSMAEILSGARKYRIGLTLAHHELRQLQRDSDVASAVMSHPFTRIVFRVGDDDAKRLAEGFSHFEAKDLRNLEKGHAICRTERSDFDFNLAIPLPEATDAEVANTRRQEVITASRKKYGRLRVDIEAALHAKLRAESPPTPETKSAARPPPDDAETKSDQNSARVPNTSEIPLPPVVETVKPSVPIPDKGIGGHQHNLIRAKIEKVAEELGYTASRENPTGSGGKIDLVLKKPNRAIACEIAITTTIDHEVGNAAKCVKAGFEVVSIISPSADRLSKIQAGVSAALSKEEASRVAYFHPDAFIDFLRESSAEVASPPATPGVTTVGKYKVKHSMVNLTPEEQKEREAAAIRLLAETMRRK